MTATLSAQTRRQALQHWLQFLRAESHVLRDRPALLFQLAANQPDSTAPARMARQRLEGGRETRPWLRWINKPLRRDGPLFTLTGHAGAVTDTAISPDGSRLVSASRDGTLKLWDLSSGADVATLRGHTEAVRTCVFSPAGELVASGSDDSTVRLWDASTGEALATLSGHGHGSSIWGVVFSPDGRRALSKTGYGEVRLWDAARGTGIAVLSSEHNASSLAVSPDSAKVVVVSGHTTKLWDGRRDVLLSSGKARVFDLGTGRELVELVGHSGQVTACAFSPDGLSIVTASSDATVCLWDGATGTQLAVLSGHDGAVNDCAFSPDGTRIVSASDDGTARLWDARRYETVATVVHGARHNKVGACRFSPDGSRVVSIALGTLMMWDSASGVVLARVTQHEGGMRTCAFSPDGSLLTSAGLQRLQILDARDGPELGTLVGHGGEITRCRFSPDGCRIASASRDGTVRVWEALSDTGPADRAVDNWALSPDGTSVLIARDDRTLERFDLIAGISEKLGRRSAAFVRACAFAPCGARILIVTDEGLTLLDYQSGAELMRMSGHGSGSAVACVFSPDGRTIATASFGEVKLWCAASGAELATLRGHSGWIDGLAFSPDGQTIVSFSSRYDAFLKVWDVNGRRERATLPCGDRAVATCAFSPDGRGILSGSLGGLTRWDAATGRELATYTFDAGRITACAWAPDGSVFVSASANFEDPGASQLAVWDPGRGVKRLLRGHTRGVTACCFSADARRVVSASEDQTVRVWDAATGAELCRYDPRGPVGAMQSSADGVYLVIQHGGSFRFVDFVKITNLAGDPAIVTAWSDPAGGLAFGCPQCRRWSDTTRELIGREVECSRCHRRLRVNPFTIDADWRPVVAAWHATT